MNIGFTGTQEGLTWNQQVALVKTLDHFPSEGSEFHHGKCIGGDEQAHPLAVGAGFRIVLHPPISGKKEAQCSISVELGDAVRPRKDYLDRNRDIVDETDLLIAGPKEETGEALRSGTWSTVRYARNKKRRIIIIRPSGKIEVENDGADMEIGIPIVP